MKIPRLIAGANVIHFQIQNPELGLFHFTLNNINEWPIKIVPTKEDPLFYDFLGQSGPVQKSMHLDGKNIGACNLYFIKSIGNNNVIFHLGKPIHQDLTVKFITCSAYDRDEMVSGFQDYES
jgi:hypothetical protein